MRSTLVFASTLVATSALLAGEPQRLGAPLTQAVATPIADLVATPERYAGRAVRVEGTVTAVCTHMGCWMALAPEGQSSPVVRLKVDDGVIVFPVSARGRRAVAEGVLERVDADPEGSEAAAEHARQAGGTLSAHARAWQIKATGAEIY